MRIFLLTLFLTVLNSCSPAFAETGVVGDYLRISQTSLPAICSIGSIRVNSSTHALSFCSTPNTWTAFTFGTVPVNSGGTGQTSYTDGQLLIGNSSGNTLAKGTLTAGADITVTNGGGSISLAVTGPTTSAISASDVDWSTLGIRGGLYTKTLGANTTFTFSNKTSGQIIVVRLTNTASNYTVTWPTVKWSGAATPTMTTGAKSDVYTFIYDGTDVFGSVVQNF